MKLNLGLIIDSLKSFAPQYISGNPDGAMRLIGVYLAFPGSDITDLDILYFSEWKNLSSRAYPKDIICIGGGKEAYESFKEHGVNSLIFSEGADPIPILREIQEIFIKYNKLERELLDTLLTDTSTRAILNCCAEFFNGHIMLFNAELRLVDYSDNYLPPDDNLLWKETIAQKRSVLPMIPREKVQMLPNRMKDFPRATFIELGDAAPPHYNIAFDQGDSRCATLIVMETKRPFSMHQHWLVDYIADMIRPNIITRYSTTFNVRDNFRKTVSTVLRHGNPDSPSVKRSLSKLGWHMNDDYQIILISLPAESKDISHYLYNYENVFANSLSDCVALHFSEFILIMLHNDACSSLNQRLPILEKQLTLDNGVCGIGIVFSDFSQLISQYTLAVMPLQNYPDDSRVRFYEEIMPLHIINELDLVFPLRSICNNGVIKIHEYDLANGTNYLLTLELYLLNNRSLAAAANKLFIHSNTMTYRLKCIEKITPLPLADPRKRLEILLSCIVLRILG